MDMVVVMTGYTTHFVSPSFSFGLVLLGCRVGLESLVLSMIDFLGFGGCMAEFEMSGNEPGKFWAAGPGPHMRGLWVVRVGWGRTCGR
ncbi:hypothetical protein CsSME_00010325 [Camellia sinensis var. sinensis]